MLSKGGEGRIKERWRKERWTPIVPPMAVDVVDVVVDNKERKKAGVVVLGQTRASKIAGEPRANDVPGRVWRLLPERVVSKHNSPIGKVLAVALSSCASLFLCPFFLFPAFVSMEGYK